MSVLSAALPIILIISICHNIFLSITYILTFIILPQRLFSTGVPFFAIFHFILVAFAHLILAINSIFCYCLVLLTTLAFDIIFFLPLWKTPDLKEVQHLRYDRNNLATLLEWLYQSTDTIWTTVFSNNFLYSAKFCILAYRRQCICYILNYL